MFFKQKSPGKALPFRGFFALGRAPIIRRKNLSVLLLLFLSCIRQSKKLIHLAHFGVSRGADNMGVGVQGQRGIGMAQNLLERFDGTPLLQKPRSEGVSKGVKIDVLKVGFFQKTIRL